MGFFKKENAHVMYSGLTRLGQGVADVIIVLKVLKDGPSYIQSILSLPSTNSRLPSEDSDLKAIHKYKAVSVNFTMIHINFNKQIKADYVLQCHNCNAIIALYGTISGRFTL